ncbi:uncharacterized protein LOC131537463 isoform X2 [Onychostoma macrolepis]|uniref:uncharacterized protein LOC131537463 isoform X2 n=1 Tax=Onychostoma macrolepis TaxID=369639 RepID=UPI00272C46DB|nr:uncharacterized protein LOC131537463 isoform X2 [Onychostoma macrolepis]
MQKSECANIKPTLPKSVHGGEGPNPCPEYAVIESAARNLLSLITATVAQEQQVQGQSQSRGLTPNQSGRQNQGFRQPSIQQEMTRSFPSMFRKERNSGKRRFPTPVTKAVAAPSKHTSLQFYLLPAPTDRTPQGSQELKFLMAGLGKRHISLPDNSNHAEITAALTVEYPKMENLMGGWLVYKGSGGSGQRKLTVNPPESEGYTAKLLKGSSNNGRHMLFIIPLQDETDTAPLPFDAPEFSKMPKSQCKTCGETLPLQALALHVESCSKPDSDQEAEEETSDCLVASTQNVCKS